MNDKFYSKMIGRMSRMPEVAFIKDIKQSLNWNLEPIRKNLYIIT